MPTLTIDNMPVEAPRGTSVLNAARTVGIRIPSLCYLEGVHVVGGCRVCLIEVEGSRTLVASCSLPVAEGMKVHTNTPRVRAARRTVVELLLSDHGGDCQTCVRSNDCELQAVARGLDVRELPFPGAHHPRLVDTSTPALDRDSSKCIMCRRCITVCSEIQATRALWAQDRGFECVAAPAFGQDLATVACVQCGQCAAVCPTAAITEKDHIDRVWAALSDKSKHVVVQTAPAIRAGLGECFGLPPGTLVTGKMVAALRRLGFHRVFDTNLTADLTILEEGTELLMRLKAALVDRQPAALPQFTSCCPAWIKFAEYFHPDLLPNLSSAKSPQQMFGAVAKTYYAQTLGRKPEELFVVSVMPCTAKKFEAQRPEMTASGSPDIDAVLTTRELGRMITQAGVDFMALKDEVMDQPLGLSSGAADIFANTGGVMEAALRTVWFLVTGQPLPFEKLHVAPIAGLAGLKEVSVTIPRAVPAWKFLEGAVLKLAVAHGLANAEHLIQRVKSGEDRYHFIEVMSCPGGCIGGGGQPRFTTNAVRLARMQAIFAEDEGKQIRASHENPTVVSLYREFLGAPLSEKSHALLHTHYHARCLN
ncbi:MAG TPA: NADH-dependent [FeFe] hydrogenase, group A6 [Opitutaceae bacterium]|nr:NADH-dependent [FeFe] hydrogenase, group A6 [Opitutaceae bacterium]